MPFFAQHADALDFRGMYFTNRQLRAVGTIPGVAVDLASGRNGPGAGRLAYDATREALRYRAPGSDTWGTWVPAADSDELLLEDGEDSGSYLRVVVYADHLADSYVEASVLLEDIYQNDVAAIDVVAADALAGKMVTYNVTLWNYGTVRLSQLKFWLDGAVADLEISENNVDWSSPTDEDNAVAFPDLAGHGGVDSLYLRRTIGAASPADPEVLNLVHCSFCGV